MKIVVVIARVLLGVGFVVFGANILVPFLPMPAQAPEALTTQFGAILGGTGWMKLVGALQFIGGALVLSGRMAPLGLTLLAPVLVNILAFHIFLEGGKGIAAGAVFTALAGFLIWAYRDNFRGLWSTDAKTTV